MAEIKTLGQLLNARGKLSEKDFDPQICPDILAYKIKWSPKMGQGLSFTTLDITSSVATFTSPSAKLNLSSLQIYCISLFCFMLSICIFSYIGFDLIAHTKVQTFLFIFALFLFFGSFIFLFANKFSIQKISFDKNTNTCFTDQYKPNHFQRINFSSRFQIRLQEIHAIQLLSFHYTRGLTQSTRGSQKNDPAWMYLIHLVCHDGYRLAITQHFNKDLVCNDAKRLSQFLNVPVWDGITDPEHTETSIKANDYI